MKPKIYTEIESLKFDFNKNGYVSIKSLFDKDDIKLIAKSIEDTLKYICNNNLDYHINIIELNKSNKELLYKFNLIANGLVTNLIVCKDINKVIDVLNDFKPFIGGSNGASMGGIMLGLPNDKRLAYNFHQESSYMRGAGRIYNVHFPIFVPSNVDNGTMSLLEGSHIEGQLPFLKSRLSEDSYTDLIPENIELHQNKYPEVFAELELGDCIIFDEFTIHKSNFNNTDQCRTVSVWRVFGNINSNAPILKPSEL